MSNKIANRGHTGFPPVLSDQCQALIIIFSLTKAKNCCFPSPCVNFIDFIAENGRNREQVMAKTQFKAGVSSTWPDALEWPASIAKTDKIINLDEV